MRSFLTALVLGSLGLTGCATQRIASPISPEVSISLVDYLRALNEAEPSDPVVDGRDPSVKARLAPPIELHRVQPELSREARRNSREGRVVLACVIERNGSVSNVRVISASGHGDFTAASVEAVRQWRYSPATIDGSAVRLFLAVTTSYRTYEEVPRRPCALAPGPRTDRGHRDPSIRSRRSFRRAEPAGGEAGLDGPCRIRSGVHWPSPSRARDRKEPLHLERFHALPHLPPMVAVPRRRRSLAVRHARSAIVAPAPSRLCRGLRPALERRRARVPPRPPHGGLASRSLAGRRCRRGARGGCSRVPALTSVGSERRGYRRPRPHADSLVRGSTLRTRSPFASLRSTPPLPLPSRPIVRRAPLTDSDGPALTRPLARPEVERARWIARGRGWARRVTRFPPPSSSRVSPCTRPSGCSTRSASG